MPILCVFGIILGQLWPTPQIWTLIEELRIGSVDGADALTTVGGIAVSPDGSMVYVSQPMEKSVRVFNTKTGVPRGKIGRSGSGPGEFLMIVRIGWKQDTLYVTDRAQTRISYFSKSGSHFRTDRIVGDPLPETRTAVIPFSVSPDGSILGEPGTTAVSVANGMVTSLPLVRMERNGTISEVVARMDIEESTTAVSAGDRLMFIKVPLQGTRIYDYSANGAYLGVVHSTRKRTSNAEFDVALLKYDGDTLYFRTYSYEPKPVMKTSSDSITKSFADIMTQQGVDPLRAQRAIERSVKLPSLQPPVTNIVVGDDGVVWLRREALNTRMVFWAVLDATGRMIATLRTPVGLQIHEVRDGYAWGVVHDGNDVPYVVRYRVQMN